MKKKLLLLSSLALLCGGLVIGTATAVGYHNQLASVQAAGNTFLPDNPAEDVKSSYKVGDELILPAGTILVGDDLVNADSSYLIYPDGNSVSKNKYILDQEGVYKAVFKGKLNGKTVNAVKTFSAYKKAYQVNSDESYASFVQHIPTKETELANNPSGIVCGLAEGDSLTINKVINIKDAKYDGGAGTPIIKLYTYNLSELANHNGAIDYIDYEADFTMVKVTDFYDPSNFITFRIGYCVANEGTGRKDFYANGASSTQTFTGLETNSSAKITIDGVGYNIRKGGGPTNFGAHMTNAPGYNGAYGTKYDVEINNTDKNGWSFYYDTPTKRMYIGDRKGILVTDLDEPAIYAGNEFKGFTTGEVIVSVSCETYYKNTAHIAIESVYGMSGEDLNLDYATDDVDPEIILSNDENNFFIAKDEPFKIFDAYSSDLHPGREVSAKVIYEYGTSFASNVSLNNKVFTPNKTGKYSIIYSAKDSYGNETQKIVTCNCVTAPNNKLVNFSTNDIASTSAGEEIVLNPVTISSLNGNEYLRIRAIYEDGEVEQIDPNDMKFFPKRVGKYSIVYSYGDNVKDYTYTYTLDSVASSNLILGQITFPKYLIKNSMNTLDQVFVTTCDSKDQKNVDPVIYVSNDGGNYSANPIDRSNFKVEANSSLKLKYTYNNKDVFETEPIQVIDAGFGEKNALDMAKYFVGNMDATPSSSAMNFVAAKSKGDGKVEFINPIAFSRFDFSVTFDNFDFETFKITMTDFYDENNTFVILLKNLGNTLSITINNISFDIGFPDSYSITYDYTTETFTDKFFNPFVAPNPMSEDKCYVTYEVTGLTKDVNFGLKKINNQILSNKHIDAYVPEVTINDLAGYFKKGDFITIKRAYACDVLSPYWEGNGQFTLKVGYTNERNEVSKFVTSIDGIELNGNVDMHRDYVVELNDFGVLGIIFEYKDQAYNSKGEFAPKFSVTGSSYITVVDREAPVISIKGANENTVDTAKINKYTTVRGYTVKDNLDSANEITVRITAISPFGEATDITADRGFTPIRYGDYIINYFAYDRAGNIATAHYVIRVK